MKYRSLMGIYIFIILMSLLISAILALLKYTGVVLFSWWWVFSPVWGSVAIFTVILSFVLGVACIKSSIDKKWITKNIYD